MGEEFCDDRALAVYLGSSFTVYCLLPPHHDCRHESPDFYWADGESQAHLKSEAL